MLPCGVEQVIDCVSGDCVCMQQHGDDGDGEEEAREVADDSGSESEVQDRAATLHPRGQVIDLQIHMNMYAFSLGHLTPKQTPIVIFCF